MPRLVLLFSGHRVDAPGRTPPRLPPSLVPRAAAAIGAALDALGAGAGDLAWSQAASGGDLLFARACIDRGVSLRVLLPVPEAEFIAQSVLGSDGDDDWPARYADVVARLDAPPRVMADELGALLAGQNAFARCNEWLLERALAHGVATLHFICLWDGTEGEPGGTAHMVDEVRRRGGRIIWIDTRELAARQRAALP